MSKISPHLFGVLGHNISYSLSPTIFSHLFSKYGLPHAYGLFDIEPERFWEFIESVRLLNIRGFNITIPFKTDLVQHVDRLDRTAARCGSINTVVNRGGRLVGYNTDGFGISMALKTAGFKDPSGKSVLILGAGGTARTALAYFLQNGISEVSIVNRSRDRLAEMVTSCKLGRKQKRIVALDPENLNSEVDTDGFDVIFNATPIATAKIVPRTILKSSGCLLQASYSVKPGRLPDSLRIASGLDMLIFQAIRSFEVFSGVQVGNYLRLRSFIKRRLG